MESISAETTSMAQTISEKPEKKKTKEIEAGVIYMSRIPTNMNVTVLRNTLNKYGAVGRMYLQVDEKRQRRKKRKPAYSEGWVQFLDKRVAKRVAKLLNASPIGGKKRQAWSEELWNMKYLPKFQWMHLCARLAYEREVREQRIEIEVDKVQREVDHYSQSAAKQNYLKRKRPDEDTPGDEDTAGWEFKQKPTEDEFIRSKPPKKKFAPKKLKEDKEFLKSLFSGGKTENS